MIAIALLLAAALLALGWWRGRTARQELDDAVRATERERLNVAFGPLARRPDPEVQ